MEIKNCILVTLNIRHWDANTLDKDVSQAVATAQGVKDKRMCRVRKSLLPKSAVMDALTATIRAARTFHYENTHPWRHEGPRILTRGNYDPYMQQMLTLKSGFETNVLDLEAEYESIQLMAQDALGTLYRLADYPSKDSLAARYGFNIGREPMPSATSLIDFGLDEAETAKIRKELEAGVLKTFSAANATMWNELYERLEKLSSKLNDEGAYVMPATIEGLRKLAERVPRINLTDDNRLDIVANHLVATLDGVTSTGVGVNPVLRGRVAKETRHAMLAMQAMMREPEPVTVSTTTVANAIEV